MLDSRGPSSVEADGHCEWDPEIGWFCDTPTPAPATPTPTPIPPTPTPSSPGSGCYWDEDIYQWVCPTATPTNTPVPTPTPTPSPTPTYTPTPTPTPSAILYASPSTILVGSTSLVIADDIEPSNLPVRWDTSGTVAESCTGASGVGPSDEEWRHNIRVTGCSEGTGTVILETYSDYAVASITITVVTPTPTPTDTPVPTPIPPTPTPTPMPTGTSVPTASPTPTATPLATPGDLRSILGPGAGKITLTWNAVAGATGYEVEQKKVYPFPLGDRWKPLPFDNFTVVTSTGTQAVVGGLENEKSYDHRVRAVNADVESGWAKLTTNLSERLKPVGLSGSVKPSSIGEITLQWNAVSVATHYEVQQKKVKDNWFDDWEILPFGNFTINFTGAQAVVGNLKYPVTSMPPYEHQVRSRNAAGPSAWSSSVETELEVLPAAGHQQDHTVRYLVAPMSATPPPGYPNPAIIIPPAVPTAVAAWNERISAHGFLICKGGTGGCDQTNTDWYTITVKLMDDSPSNPNANSACTGIACVRKLPLENSLNVTDHDLILEQPAYALGVRYFWTKWDILDLQEIGSTGFFWASVGVSLRHELGHTLGIPHPPTSTYPGLMSDSKTYQNITQADIDDLKKIYSGHEKGE